jgi:hypothetical protein
MYQFKVELFSTIILYMLTQLLRYASRTGSGTPSIPASVDQVGMIISLPTGKCVGIIDRKGRIEHCNAASALSPYKIIMKPNAEMQIAVKTKKDIAIGQCVDIQGNTIAELVRKNNKNSMKPTTKSKAPILAVVVPESRSINNNNQERSTNPSIDDLIHESKTLIDDAARS